MKILKLIWSNHNMNLDCMWKMIYNMKFYYDIYINDILYRYQNDELFEDQYTMNDMNYIAFRVS